MDVAHPSRPEDIAAADPRAAAAAARPTAESSSMYIPHVALRPRMFMNETCLAADENLADERFESGADINGELPGLVPWRYFFINTIVVACLWWVAAFVSAVDAYAGTMTFVQPRYGLEPHEVAPLPLLQRSSRVVIHPFLKGERIQTGWPTVERPHGLACDASGSVFVAAGRSAGGRRGLLTGRLAHAPDAAGHVNTTGGQALARQMLDKNSMVRFGIAPTCDALGAEGSRLQDFAFPPGPGADFVAVLPAQGGRLVRCPLAEGAGSTTADGGHQPLGRAWLEDRGGILEDDFLEDPGGSVAGLLQPEDFSALALAPCPGSDSGGGRQEQECAVLATTAKRVVLMGAPSSSTAPSPAWVPRQLLRNVMGQAAPGPGSLALLDGRFLGVLDQSNSLLHVLDLQHDGRVINSYRLPHHRRDETGAWASICAGGGAFYAIEDHEQPSLWRFPVPMASLRS